MIVKEIIDERLDDYKYPSLFICTSMCDMKCCKDYGEEICHNEWLLDDHVEFDITPEDVLEKYQKNPVTKAIVFGGLEPMLQYEEVFEIISYIRMNGIPDDIVIYTGYNKEEVSGMVQFLSMFSNIVFKFGRYIPNDKPHFDEVLGIELASSNQYGERI